MWTSSGRPLRSRAAARRRAASTSLHAGRLVVGRVAAEVAGQQQHVDAGRVEQRLADAGEREHVALAGPGQVDRVRHPAGRDLGLQRGDRRGIQRRHVEADVGEEVGGDRPVPAAVGHDRHPAAPQARRAEQRRGGVGQLAERVDEPRPGLLEGRLQHPPGRGQRPGVRGRGGGAGGGASGGQHQHRLSLGHPPHRGDQGPAVAGVLDVAGGEPGLVVVGGRREHVGHRHVGGVAEGHEPAVAEAVLVEQDAELDRQVAALGSEGHRAGPGVEAGGVELQRGLVDPEAVRPDERPAGGPHPLDQRPLGGPAVGAVLGEARSDDHERPGARREPLVDHRRHRVRRDGQDGQVGRLRQGRQARVQRPPAELAAAPVHQVQRRAARHVERAGEPAAPGHRIRARADQRHRPRGEQRPQVARRGHAGTGCPGLATPSSVSTPRFSSPRATISRWISLVPSQMRSTRSSRRKRSATFVRM